jgi:hypothetical protein
METTFPQVVDSTMRGSFLKCPHDFFRAHCQGLTTQEAPSIDLHFGACVAKGLEASRRYYYEHGTQSEAVVEGARAIIEAWGTFTFEPRNRNQQNKSLENCLLAHRDYFREWPLDTDHLRIHVHEGQPCIEFAGAVELPDTRHPETGEPIGYAGRFDLIGDYRSSTWGDDDKTTGSNVAGRDWSEQWRLRGQFTGYVYIAQHYGIPLQGFIVRGIQILTDQTKLAECIAPRPRWMIQRWLDTLLRDLHRMIQYWHRWKETGADESYPQVLDSGCYNYNRPCQFMPLCTAEHPERWLDTYHVNRWNPLERST